MNRTRPLLLGLLTLFAAHAEAQESLRAVERKIQGAWEAVSTLVATVKMETLMPAGAKEVMATGEGRLEYMKAEPRAKYRQRMDLEVPAPLSLKASFEFLFDGEFLYLINEIMDQKTIAKSDAPDFENGALPPGGKELLDALRAKLDLSLQPESEVGGHKTYVIEGKRHKADAADPVQRALFYIDKENGIQRRAEFFTADGKLNTSISYEDFRLNIPVDQSRFIYDGPQPPEEQPDSKAAPAPPVQIP